uniref:Uncharacterized protein n=1 Tax=viral metagenome TaxID=1070528 RepID=A0A6M3III7_9ZZZZ
MAKTTVQLRRGLSEELGDWFQGTVDSGGAKNWFADSELADKRTPPGPNQWVLFVSGTTSTSDDGKVRLINRFSDEENSHRIFWLEALAGDVVSGIVYEIHSYHPDDLKRALNQARFAIAPYATQELVDKTLTSRRIVKEYTLPSTFSGPPSKIYLGRWAQPDWDENLLTNGDFSDFTGTQPDNWETPAQLVLAEEDETNTAHPFGGGNVVKCTTNSTTDQLKQTLSNPTYYAGQKLYVSIAVYSETAARLKAFIYDGSTTTKSTNFHAGGGWEVMTTTAVMPAAPSEVSCGVDDLGGTIFTFYCKKAVLVATGEEPSGGRALLLGWRMFKDMIYFPFPLEDNRPMILEGEGYMSAVSAETDTMEISDPQTYLLYAYAGRWLAQNRYLRRPSGSTKAIEDLAYWDDLIRRRIKLFSKGVTARYRKAPLWRP